VPSPSTTSACRCPDGHPGHPLDHPRDPARIAGGQLRRRRGHRRGRLAAPPADQRRNEADHGSKIFDVFHRTASTTTTPRIPTASSAWTGPRSTKREHQPPGGGERPAHQSERQSGPAATIPWPLDRALMRACAVGRQLWHGQTCHRVQVKVSPVQVAASRFRYKGMGQRLKSTGSRPQWSVSVGWPRARKTTRF
jgi:hypothetical protein